MGPTITAKYPGRCAACGCPHIIAGETLITRMDGRWAAVECIKEAKQHEADRQLVAKLYEGMRQWGFGLSDTIHKDLLVCVNRRAFLLIARLYRVITREEFDHLAEKWAGILDRRA